jgi:hypothetical protein
MQNIDFKNIQNGQYVESVVSFIERYLPTFALNATIENDDNEWFLNDKLAQFLTHEARFPENLEEEFPFTFFPEPKSKKESGKPDIGAMIVIRTQRNYDPFFTIECKRLPTPRSKTEEKKEYVTGLKGGITRFKRNEHGVDLPINAMIGYIEKYDFEYWQNEINLWIESLNGTIEEGKETIKNIKWSSDEILEKIYFNEIARLHSKHPRINTTSTTELTLIHFWVKIKTSNQTN